MVSHSIFQKTAMLPSSLKVSDGLPGDLPKNLVDPGNSSSEAATVEKKDSFSSQINLPPRTDQVSLSNRNYFDMAARWLALMFKVYLPKLVHTTQDEMPHLGLDATKEIAKDEHSRHQDQNNNGDNNPPQNPNYSVSASAKPHVFPGRII